MAWRSWRAPKGQGVTFVELFFDLVFVFAVTGVARVAIHEPTWLGGAHALLVFWMVWWAWTQLTWALNGADTTAGPIRAGTLAATAVGLLMAVSIQDAFEPEGGLAFALPYVAVRVLGLGLYLRVAAGSKAWFKAVRSFATFSILGLAAATIGGFAEPADRLWWWLGTLALDIVAALVGGRHPEWNLHAPHFAERHGLFVIIALGESLLAVGMPAVETARTTLPALVLVAAAAVVCLLWWTYFGWFKDALEHELAQRVKTGDPQFARDAYSLLHFPLVLGIVGVAVGLEPMIAHPDEVVSRAALASFAVGLVLFVASSVPISLRARWRVPRWRVAFTIAMAGLFWLAQDTGPAVVILTAGAALLALVAVEMVFPQNHGARRPPESLVEPYES